MAKFPKPTVWQIKKAFKRHGLKYVQEKGAVRRHRSRSRLNPWPYGLRAIVDHHTAGVNSLGYLMNRSGSSNMPFCNALIDRDGTLHILSWGACWHSGAGGPWNGVAGKDSLHLVAWGTEVEDRGQYESFTYAQLETLGRLNAALVSLGVPARNEINHRDWTDGTGGVSSSTLRTRGRKIDTRYDTGFLRRNTRKYKIRKKAA